MTRQAQVVRSSSRSGPAAHRDLNSTVIHCLVNSCGQQWYGGGSAGGIEVAAADPYQRFFFSVTIGRVHCFEVPGGASVAAYVALNYEGIDLSVVAVMDGSATLTGVADLRAGMHTIETLVLPWQFGGGVAIDGVAMQCIEGQIVDTPSCAGPGTCH